MRNHWVVVKKFFKLDKNYLLEEAQLQLRGNLLLCLVDLIKAEYERKYNPLGIADEFVLKVRQYQPDDLQALNTFYETLAGVYRFKFGDNQLEFMWDGVDQSERYRAEWTEFFKSQTTAFCKNELFIRAVLDLTVFNNYSQLAENRMNNFMLQTFDVKLRNGLIRVA